MKFKGPIKYAYYALFTIVAAILLIVGFLVVGAHKAHAQSGSSLWKLSGTTLSPVNSAWTLTIPGMNGTGSTRCVQITSAGLLQVASAACGSGGGGSSTALDLGDNGSDESAGITEIATTGDTNSIFTEPSDDKLLINLGLDWPKADTSDDLTCTDCIGTTEIADSYVLNSGDTVTGDLFVNALLQVGNGATSGGEVRIYEDSDNGSDYLSFVAPSSIGTSRTCNLTSLSSFIPDSCVGNGVDDSGGVSFTIGGSYASSSGTTELTLNKVDIGDENHVDFTTTENADTVNNLVYRDLTGSADATSDGLFFYDSGNLFLRDVSLFFQNVGLGLFRFDGSAIPSGETVTAKLQDYSGAGGSYNGSLPLWETGASTTPGDCIEVGATAFTINSTGAPCGSGGGAWGSITGTLSDQTDLQSALDAKAPLASPTFTGTVTVPATLNFTSNGSIVKAGNHAVTLTSTGATNVTLPTSGTLATTSQIPSSADVSTTNTGTSTTTYVTPDGLAGSIFGTPPLTTIITDTSYLLTTGDDKARTTIPSSYNGMNVVSVNCQIATASSSGTPTFTLERGRRSSATSAPTWVDVLSTAITIDANEFDSKDATTPAVINASNDDVATGDYFRWNVDGVGTGSRGLICEYSLRLP